MAEEESVSMKVKLKVHYTFDTEHKLECLSRPSESHDVDTVALEDGTSIGIIDLRTCLQAITSSSPELTHFHDSDYTVYAYDYSESNTPLVGQGMLSKVLMQEATATEAMVTGRVTKSLMAKLKKNVEPFLEVKLRLTPIASVTQRGRSGSMSSVGDSGHSQWSSFSQIGPAGGERPQSPADLSRLENMQRTLHEGGPRRDSIHNNSYPWGVSHNPSSRPATPTQFSHYQPQPSSTHSRHAGQNFTFQNHHFRRESESGYGSGDDAFEDGPARKRAKITRVQPTKKNSFNIEQQPNSLRTAAMGASSLRMHQPTPINPAAALQRGLSTEEPVRPPTPVPRVRPSKKPTGRPRGRPPKNRTVENAEPSSPVASESVNQQVLESEMSSPEDTRNPHANESVMSTPVDIPSSPPLPSAQPAATSPDLPENINNVQKTESNQDSGYFSAQIESEAGTNNHKDTTANDDDIFGDLDTTAFPEGDMSWFDGTFDSNMMNVDMDAVLEDQGVDNHFTPVFDDESTIGGPTPQAGPTPAASNTGGIQEHDNRPRITPSPVPQTIPTPTLQPKTQSQPPLLPRPPPVIQPEFQRPILPASYNPAQVQQNGRPVPNLLPRPPIATFQRSQSVLPPVPASDPGFRHFQRSNTWAPDGMSDAIMSDASGPGDNRNKSRKRVGKEQTQARLENAIAQGGMPPFCHHCGSIETPAWRRGYIKHFTCPFDSVPITLEPGGMIYKEVLEANPNGTVKLWKGWKVERLPTQTDSDWEQINLCNPCGLFLHKNKRPRPAEKWQKKEKTTEKRKRKRPPKPPKSRTNPPRVAAGNMPSEIQSDVQEPPSEESSPADTTAEDVNDDSNETGTVNGDGNDSSQEPELPPMPKNIMSDQPSRRTVKWADTHPRQAQSSPIAKGTIEEPIDIDLTPKPLRRRLFSPSSHETYGVYAASAILTENKNVSLLPSFVRRSPRLNKTKDVFETIAIVDHALISADKENVAPSQNLDDDTDFNDIFGGDHDDFMAPPATPTPKRRSERILLQTPGKTPTREFGNMINGNGQQINKTPKNTGSLNLAELMMGTAMRNIDPKHMTPHTRALFHACSDIQTPSSKHSQGRTGFTPKAMTPGRSSLNFGFPDLPSLKPSSPMSHDETGHAFSELPTDRLYSNFDDDPDTDPQMPSSPPVSGWNLDDFGGMVDFEAFENTNWALVEEHDQEATPKPRTPSRQKGKDLLSVDTPGRTGLRRSPRRAGRE